MTKTVCPRSARLRKLVFFIVLMAQCLYLPIASASDDLLESNRVAIAGANFDVRVSSVDASNIRKISIRCISGCPSVKDLTENVMDFPVSEFRLGDNSELFFLLLTTGSAYRVKVYQLNPTHILKVLDVGGKSIDSVGYHHDREYVALSDGKARSLIAGTARYSSNQLSK